MGIWQIIKGEEPGYIKQWLNYENTGQFGEYLIDYALSNNLFEGMYVLLRNVYIPYHGSTSEIDLLMIHVKGIFVI